MQLVLLSLGLTVLAVAGSVLAAWLYSDRKFKLLLIWIPLCLLASSGTYWTLRTVAGWPSEDLPDNFTPLAYKTDGKELQIWALEKGSTKPRNFVQPYDKDLHQMLEAAKQSAAAGKPKQIQRKGKNAGLEGKGEESAGEWKSYNLRTPESLPPKEMK